MKRNRIGDDEIARQKNVYTFESEFKNSKYEKNNRHTRTYQHTHTHKEYNARALCAEGL